MRKASFALLELISPSPAYHRALCGAKMWAFKSQLVGQLSAALSAYLCTQAAPCQSCNMMEHVKQPEHLQSQCFTLCIKPFVESEHHATAACQKEGQQTIHTIVINEGHHHPKSPLL